MLHTRPCKRSEDVQCAVRMQAAQERAAPQAAPAPSYALRAAATCLRNVEGGMCPGPVTCDTQRNAEPKGGGTAMTTRTLWRAWLPSGVAYL